MSYKMFSIWFHSSGEAPERRISREDGSSRILRIWGLREHIPTHLAKYNAFYKTHIRLEQCRIEEEEL